MSQYYIHPNSLDDGIQEWGSLQPIIDRSRLGAKSGFSMGLITYKKPHYSGYHDDHELIYILEGKSTARINGEEISFEERSVLIIPVNTEHQISEVREGPVRAVLIHVQLSRFRAGMEYRDQYAMGEMKCSGAIY